MSNGGDWNTEGNGKISQKTTRPVDSDLDDSLPEPRQVFSPLAKPQAQHMNRIITAIIGVTTLGFVVVFYLISIEGKIPEKRFVPVEKPPESSQVREPNQVREVIKSPTESQAEKVALRKTNEEYFDAIREAAGNLDTQKRDSLARELVNLQPEGPMVGFHRIFASVGAWEVLLEIPPSRSRIWYDVAMRTASFDRILSSDSILTNETDGARALCFAGSERALELYQSQVNSPLESADAIACGLNSTLAPMPFRGLRLSDQAVAVAASREAVDLYGLYLKIRTRKGAETSPLLMDIEAALYVAGKIEAQALVEIAANVEQDCKELPRGRFELQESVEPSILIAAAKKLEASMYKSALKSQALENLKVGAALAGYLRLEDTRGDLKSTSPQNERCLAQVEYQFEPEAALSRLKRVESTEDPSHELQTMLALTSARAGHFDDAFDHTKKALELVRHNSQMHTELTWMLVAFAHKTGQLGQLNPAELNEEMLELVNALQGGAAELTAYRLADALMPRQATTLVELYLLGATAPGHEEAFMDGLVVQRATVSHYQFVRAEAATWLGDAESAKKWTERREALHLRAAEGKFGGHHLLWTR